MIVRDGCCPMAEIYAMDLEGVRTLPVFGREETAKAFIGSWMPHGSWRVRQTSTGELLSMLYGPSRNTEHVLLDPSPAARGAGNKEDHLVASRDRFIGILVAGGRMAGHIRDRHEERPAILQVEGI